MNTELPTLARADFLRAPIRGAARPENYKEWHHFVIQRGPLRVIVNFSLMSESFGAERRVVPRVVVIVHDGGWTGAIERFSGDEAIVGADLRSVTIGSNRMDVAPDQYAITLDLAEPRIRGQLRFVPASRPFAVHNQPLGAGRLSWLFVPRLRADGWLQADRSTYRFEHDLAYHDHNWGRFRWGDDFGWEWGSVLASSSADQPWSFVFMRMMDRCRHRALSQALYAWHEDEPVAMFRDAELRVTSTGLLGRPADCTLPPAMAIVLPGTASDIPARVQVDAAASNDHLTAVFEPASYARVAQPSEDDWDRSVVLNETSGAARVAGTAGGHSVDFTGTGVFEFLHG